MIKFKYLPITKNRDKQGHILTYSVTLESGLTFEFNTLKEAKSIAKIVDSAEYVKPKGAYEILGEFYPKREKV